MGFSGTDDRYERDLARYLARRMPGTHYASVVVNDGNLAARMWLKGRHGCRPTAIGRILLGGLREWLPPPGMPHNKIEEQFSRQVLAFGRPLQERLSRLKVGVIGLGGLGSILVEELCRLGISHWVLVDNDVIEETNLNRVTGSTLSDARRARNKVVVAMRNILRVNPWAYVTALRSSVLEPKVAGKLKGCDLLAVCTDNDSSRLVVNRLAAQYLIPLLHVGYAIETHEGKVSEVSGEYAITSPGEWCLFCSGIVDGQGAARELASPQELAILRERGYIANTPAPAVYHLDGVVASLAAAEVHNLAHPYRDARRYLVYDDIKGELMPLSVELQEGCPVCSPEGALGLGDLEPLPDYGAATASGLQMPSADDEDSTEEDVKEARGC